MTHISDEYMYEMLAKIKDYSIVILRPGPKANEPGIEKIIWEHGRRNFALRADGLLSIVCPVTIQSNVSGIGIFNTSMDETKKIMDDDPGVQAAVFEYEIYPCKSFPGDRIS